MTETLRDRVVDAALALAERRSWEEVRLHDVAAEIGVGLNDVRVQFREKEEIVDAWFDRADEAMLREAAEAEIAGLTPRQRLHRLVMVWLGALAPHRRVARQMILGKLEPGHVHYQFSGLLRVSRTVQWLREAASRDAVLPWRALEETALTSIYLATFLRWMQDESADPARTSVLLERLLTAGECASEAIPDWLAPGRAPAHTTAAVAPGV
ncbi:MAG: TetR family transcriptional regulator [Candidatus Muproteobacteria bacterium RBG_16_65_34]|uniref:TetR family transcriptional regulator n=1 Tax=Candidatus Muproteobacteria bacterium RBG_16_65_34 TaxID=1817760 RepID=A0A1F6TV94_9PROT|nr:MAG: TetR family transcriptional regulator [Candidatus Muproteobacteria bacterium RBG_16_65_34]